MEQDVFSHVQTDRGCLSLLYSRLIIDREYSCVENAGRDECAFGQKLSSACSTNDVYGLQYDKFLLIHVNSCSDVKRHV